MKIASFLKKLGAKKILIVVCLLLLASFLCIYTLKGRNGDSKTPQTISNPPQKSVTAVEKNGQLKVAGGKLCNEKGTAIQLKGMSSHGLQWFS
ncbi:MAG: hypothetical protein Q8930_04020, partial [Bacillota bacterium]|nr:hypothetical protein [Bacillota bacterium]